MKVRFFAPVFSKTRDALIGYGNVTWDATRSMRMRVGKFGPDHPCAANPEPTVFEGDRPEPTDDPLGKFRALGYHASCFPEGDGIAFAPLEDKTHEQQVRDLVECFGFEVDVVRAD